MLEVWLLGLISGLTLLISSSTLNFWLAKSGVSIVDIGLFSIISIPYAINFLWAPIIDSLELPFLTAKFGQRKGWIILLGILLTYSIYLLSFLSPQQNLYLIAIAALLVSFFSSTLDIALGALRSELLKEKEHGPASGVYLFGYRFGMIISKSGAIYLSYYINWSKIYEVLSLVVFFLITIILYFAPFKETIYEKTTKVEYTNLKEFFSKLMNPIGSVKFICILFIFLILYRLPDNILGSMLSPFLLQVGFNEVEISTAGYLCGSIFSIVGGVIAGLLIERLGVYKSLLYFGSLHALTHLLFNLFSLFGKNIYCLAAVISLEGLTGGMAMASYIALITSLCKGKYRGTQYSLFSAMMGVSRSVLPAISGILVLQLGWTYFFLIVFMLSIPSLVLLKNYFLHEQIKQNLL